MTKEIADAFGLPPDSLEPVEHDEHDEDVASAVNCQSCHEWERRYAELASELAECRKDVERYQMQIEQLMQALETGCH